jgi:hypothetical protein
MITLLRLLGFPFKVAVPAGLGLDFLLIYLIISI